MKRVQGAYYHPASHGEKGHTVTICQDCGYTYGWHGVRESDGKPMRVPIHIALKWADNDGWRVAPHRRLLCPFCWEHPLGRMPTHEERENVWNIQGNKRNPDYKRQAMLAARSLMPSLYGDQTDEEGNNQ